MPASKLNYAIIFEGDSQIYGCASKQIALNSVPPEGIPIEHKHVYFITHEPDNNRVVAHELPTSEVIEAFNNLPTKDSSDA